MARRLRHDVVDLKRASTTLRRRKSCCVPRRSATARSGERRAPLPPAGSDGSDLPEAVGPVVALLVHAAPGRGDAPERPRGGGGGRRLPSTSGNGRTLLFSIVRHARTVQIPSRFLNGTAQGASLIVRDAIHIADPIAMLPFPSFMVT